MTSGHPPVHGGPPLLLPSRALPASACPCGCYFFLQCPVTAPLYFSPIPRLLLSAGFSSSWVSERFHLCSTNCPHLCSHSPQERNYATVRISLARLASCTLCHPTVPCAQKGSALARISPSGKTQQGYIAIKVHIIL